MRELEEVKREIDAITLYRKSGIFLKDIDDIVYTLSHGWDGKKLFLQDGDALVYPINKLKEVFLYIHEKLPSVERIAAYATAQDILRIDLNDLKDLEDMKLLIIYMGLESGDDDVLKKIHKNSDSAQMIEAARKIREAGIMSSITVILGLGSVDGSEKHALETARVLTEMDPDYVGALTLTMVPGTPLYQDSQQGKFTLVSPFQSLVELKMIIGNSSFTNCFFSSVHASNYFTVRGTLPQDKERMLAELQEIIDKGDPFSLRPEMLRGL
jgi:radical SAM superfamily enzyme YgiQ (UPF0313 family)